MQTDQPAESKKLSKKDRKGKKNKRKRDKSSKGKRKGKGKGKKGSRKKKHGEESPDEGFHRATTTLPEFQSQKTLHATELPETESNLETVVLTDMFDKIPMVMPTYKPDFTSEAPNMVTSTLPVSKVIKKVDNFISRCDPP